jgi:hypothetical protein
MAKELKECSADEVRKIYYDLCNELATIESWEQLGIYKDVVKQTSTNRKTEISLMIYIVTNHAQERGFSLVSKD